MSLSEMKKELRELRKQSIKPVSRMKKADVMSELEKLKGLHKEEVKEVKKVLEKEEAPKKVVKKVEKAQEKEHKKQEKVVEKKEKVKKEVKKEDVPSAKYSKSKPSEKKSKE